MPILIIQSSKVKSSYNVNISSKFKDLFTTIHRRKDIKLFLSSKKMTENPWLLINVMSSD